MTTARSSARHWVGCPFQARPEWTGCDAVGQAELQPGVPILCMAIIGEMREREREEEGRKEGRKGRRKEGREPLLILNECYIHILAGLIHPFTRSGVIPS